MGKRLLETTFPLLHLLSIVSPYCCWVEKCLSKNALADYQLSLPSFTFTFDVLWLSTCCCWATFSTAAFALQSSSCGCLLFLGWTGCSFRNYSMRQRFFYVAKMIGQRFLETTSPLLYLLCVDVCCISFLFLGWKGFSPNKFKMIINYQSLAFTFLVLYLVAVAAVEGLLRGGGPASLNCCISFAFLFLYLHIATGMDRGGLFNSSWHEIALVVGQGLVETIFYPLRLLSGSFFNCCSGGKVSSRDKFWADLGRYGPTKCLCSPSHFLLSVLVAALAWLSLEKAGPGSLTCCLVLAFLVLSSCALSGLGTLPPLGTVKQIFEKISCPLHLTVIHRPSPWLGGRRMGYLDKAEPKTILQLHACLRLFTFVL